MNIPSLRASTLPPLLAATLAWPLITEHLHAAEAPSAPSSVKHFAQAAENAKLVREGYHRGQRYVDGWLEFRDKQGANKTQLIPNSLTGAKSGWWWPRDAAADNYPFMVLTTSFTHPRQYNGIMRDILAAERKHASLPDGMPAPYRFDTGEQNARADLAFEASEYVKDGLMAITEWLGTDNPWFERMIEIQSTLWDKHASEKNAFGAPMVSQDVEVNGEQLQVLSRLYWITGEAQWLEYATRLGDHYILGEGKHPTDDFTRLRLRDHGNEIMGGLTELYATLTVVNPAQAAGYKQSLYRLYDRVLEVGRNEDGFFHDEINPRTGEILNQRLADNFGYVLNGYYTLYLLDKSRTAYRDAVRKVLENIHPKYLGNDFGERMDGRADAAEGVMNLLNREFVPGAELWVDDTMRAMWSLQKDNGVIEGWHGDGNFARTTIMYCLWKSQGLTFAPYDARVELGAVNPEGVVYVSLHSEADYQGRLRFDPPRHRTSFKLPLDWPRINQFPEWFTAEPGETYELHDLATGERTTRTGEALIEGISILIKAGETKRLLVRKRQ